MRWVALALAVAACAGPRQVARPPPLGRSGAREPADARAIPPQQAPAEVNEIDEAFGSLCRMDATLGRAARRLAERSLAERPADATTVEATLRELGSADVRPYAWTLTDAASIAEARERARQFFESVRVEGERRCGIARLQQPNGRTLVTAIAVDALAELDALPARVAFPSWVELRASIRVPANAAKVVVLGPRGLPKPVPTSFDGQHVLARFAADQDGTWTVQVLADVRGGPRPVLESRLRVGSDEVAERTDAAPGEVAGNGPGPPAGALLRMVNAARRSEGLAPLQRDEALDELAAEHAERMRRARRVAHELGDGNPAQRVQAAGLAYEAVGENVCHAGSIALAHRALWASPSHRAALLDTHFDSIGIGTSTDSNGEVWVAELFAESAVGVSSLSNAALAPAPGDRESTR